MWVLIFYDCLDVAVRIEAVILAELAKKFPAVYGHQRYLTDFKRRCHRPLT
jgi:hypothetical protein